MKHNQSIVYVLLAIVSCSLLSILGYGAWKLLVGVVTAIINQGTPAIVSAILTGLFTWYCILPLFALVAIIAIQFWLVGRHW